MRPLLCLVILLVISSASALQNVMHIAECSELSVEVEGELPIEPGEYWFFNCIRTGDNRWFCDCHDNYDLVMGNHIMAVNNYTIYANYTYTEEVGGSSGGGYMNENFPHHRCTSAEECVNDFEVDGCYMDGCNVCCEDDCSDELCEDDVSFVESQPEKTNTTNTPKIEEDTPERQKITGYSVADDSEVQWTAGLFILVLVILAIILRSFVNNK